MNKEPGLEVEGSVDALKGLFKAPTVKVLRTEVVEATELEIAAAIVVLVRRTESLGDAYLPLEVKAHPFNPKEGWRQAALNFIRQNREQAAKGNPILI